MKFIMFVAVALLFLVSIPAFSQPVPPTNLVGTIGGMGHFSSINLTWHYALKGDSVRFNIYKKNGGLNDTVHHYNRIFTTIDTSFYDFFVQTGNTYSYYVTALINHSESDSSNNIEVQTIPPVITFGKISGTLVDDSTKLPIAGGMVNFIPASGMMPFMPQAQTDSNGFFTIKLRAGQYYIFSGAKGYVGEFYDNVSSILQATKVTLNANDSLTFNIGLKKITPPVFYSLTGSVKDGSGNPQRALMTAFIINHRWPIPLPPWGGGDHGWINPPNSWNNWGRGSFWTKTDSLGNYKFMFNANDTVVIYADPWIDSLMPQFWNNKTTFNAADRIPITGNVTDINFILGAKPVYANGMSGSVKDSSGAIPLNAYVYAYNTHGNKGMHTKYFVGTDTTTGDYSFTNVIPGKYILLAWSMGYKPSFFRYDGTPTFDWKQADSVVVTDSGVVGNINFKLQNLHHVRDSLSVIGSVAGNTGAVLDGALVYATDQSGNIAGGAITDLDGSFQIDGLTPGNYTVVSGLLDFGTSQIGNITVDNVNSVQSVNVVLNPAVVLGVMSHPQVVSRYALAQNYPNPFNPTTVISYQLGTASYVTVKIYNALGQEVTTLVNGMQGAGVKSASWNAGGVASGVYYYRLNAVSASDPTKAFTQTQKMLLIK
ncbi:MAG: carboxypeptidase regulatory-like domain-containing protein [Bacteroidota bacterium]